MKFINFKNTLENNKIILFDSQYRILHERIINLSSILEKNNQTGSISPFFIIKKKQKAVQLLNILLKNDRRSAINFCKL
jgi:hypothetical protein